MQTMQLGTDSTAREALQLLLALGLGAAVGLERRLRGHPAGIHTNALVSLGSAAFVIAGLSMGGEISRVAAQVVTGSGFICAGVILHRGANISGLNTAATLWCASAVAGLPGRGRNPPYQRLFALRRTCAGQNQRRKQDGSQRSVNIIRG
jgi:uncharacterized membrane protein YhiD involved in acid resistance